MGDVEDWLPPVLQELEMMAREQTHYLAETECESVLAAEQSKDFDPEKIMTESLLVGEEGEVVVILPLKILDGEERYSAGLERLVIVDRGHWFGDVRI